MYRTLLLVISRVSRQMLDVCVCVLYCACIHSLLRPQKVKFSVTGHVFFHWSSRYLLRLILFVAASVCAQYRVLARYVAVRTRQYLHRQSIACVDFVSSSLIGPRRLTALIRHPMGCRIRVFFRMSFFSIYM